jgi:hypothetical protein
MGEDTDTVEALAEGADPPPIEQPAATVTSGDLDAVYRDVLNRVQDPDAELTAAYAAGYVDAARHFEQALKHRLGLDDADHRD